MTSGLQRQGHVHFVGFLLKKKKKKLKIFVRIGINVLPVAPIPKKNRVRKGSVWPRTLQGLKYSRSIV